MSSSDDESDAMSVVFVSLNITETTNVNGTGNLTKTFSKRPNEDSSITNILVGIGIVAVALGLLVALIKLIRICYKMWQAEDEEENKTDQMKNAPLLPLSGSKAVRRNSSIRNPNAPIHRSSLNIETQMEIRQKRLSQTYSNTPPAVKKP
ncbi:unnamed protein product [Adineta ricciae]|uniref:Uncharacterized protein n=1 Tax=Adineta ricciae TaxID=249248 RepID=A0A814LEX4_ADIRI|nr:unnamed protein product [Adineta ricciae]